MGTYCKVYFKLIKTKNNMKKNTKAIQEFCKTNNLTYEQFIGKDSVGGNLDLEGLTSIPEGFNPTVGGYLDLGGLTSIPEGFNPTVGGLSLIHISEPTRRHHVSRMPSSA